MRHQIGYSHIPLSTMLRKELDDNTLDPTELLSITKNATQGAVNQYNTTGRVPRCAAIDDSEYIWIADLAEMRNGNRRQAAAFLIDAAVQLPRGYVANSYRKTAAMLTAAPNMVTEEDSSMLDYS